MTARVIFILNFTQSLSANTEGKLTISIHHIPRRNNWTQTTLNSYAGIARPGVNTKPGNQICRPQPVFSKKGCRVRACKLRYGGLLQAYARRLNTIYVTAGSIITAGQEGVIFRHLPVCIGYLSLTARYAPAAFPSVSNAHAPLTHPLSPPG